MWHLYQKGTLLSFARLGVSKMSLSTSDLAPSRDGKSSFGVFFTTAVLLTLCLWYWMFNALDGLTFFVLFWFTPIAGGLIAVPTLIAPEKLSWLIAAGLVVLVNVVGANGKQIGKHMVRQSQAATIERLETQMANFTPTHFVSGEFAVIENRPRSSNSTASARLLHGDCVQLLEMFVNNGSYSSVIVSNVDGKRYIYAPHLTRLGNGQSCDASHRLVN
ncbi:hypothetical protein AN476_08655 [Phaeobacter sp. 11ANDIMAR09]|nr:hypothetical protein AN476_08655 [Phaeobacter sp. 11ANDIMAR09]